MVISHLPVGYITAYYLEKKYWKEFSRKQVIWLYGVLLFFSVAPDFDLAYFWFVNGMGSHREFFTHAFLFYVFLALAAYAGVIGWGKLKQRKIPLPTRTTARLNECPFGQVQSGGYPPLEKGERKRSEQKKCSLERFAMCIAMCIAAGALSHLILDSLLSCAGWAWPLYANPIGLPLMDIYFGWIKNYYFPLFMAIEFGVAVIALYTLINANKNLSAPACACLRRQAGRQAGANQCENYVKPHLSSPSKGEGSAKASGFINGVFIVLLAAAVLLPFSLRKSFYMPPDICNRDFDNDGIKNDRDFDFDNDGIENFYDKDANGNGVDNSAELSVEAKKMIGIYSSGGNKFLRSFLILGMISDVDILINSFEKAGIFLIAEMNNNFLNNTDDYQRTAYDYKFSKDSRNIYSFFKNKKLLLCDGDYCGQIHYGDILFFGASRDHIAIAVDAMGDEYSVIEVGEYHKRAVLISKSEMEQLYGFPQAIARLP